MSPAEKVLALAAFLSIVSHACVVGVSLAFLQVARAVLAKLEPRVAKDARELADQLQPGDLTRVLCLSCGHDDFDHFRKLEGRDALGCTRCECGELDVSGGV